MRELPTGTVTFLFTDVEGSTRLLHALGEAYAEALAEHRRALRDAFVAHGGVEVDTQGDAFFVAFETASDALAAAATGRDAIETGPIRVRMGVHTGEPVVTDEGYVGIDVHRAARIAAAGHGGQILVSQSTRDLVGAESLRDLGEHRLKDLTAPERIYQLGDGDFPPLKSLNQTNLPVQPGPLVGREQELAEIKVLLRASRLLTLTGPGGSGKTRLAVQAAAEVVDDFPDGVWFVSLAAVHDPQFVEPTIARAIGARDDLIRFLSGKKMLLLLDNLEQLLPEVAPRIAQFETPVLATSRERLNLAAEQEYPVPTLPLDDAVSLFVQRARQLKPGFEPDEHVIEIARRLDGLPLAVELAAARVKVLTTEQIHDRLGHSLDLLTGGARDAPERQRTLRATIEWSYSLLGEEEHRSFTRLAVFAGSFSLDAADEVCNVAVDALQSLVDKSLLRQTEAGRFFMLETIREYAAERLAATGDEDELRLVHAGWLAALAERAEPELERGDQVLWLDRLDDEREELRAALAWALDNRPVLASRILGPAWKYWLARAHLGEARRWYEKALQREFEPGRRVRLLKGLGNLAAITLDAAAARAAAEERLELGRRLRDDREVCGALNALGIVAFGENRLEDAEALFGAAETAAPNDAGRASSVGNRGVVLAELGRFDEGRECAKQAVAMARRTADLSSLAVFLERLAEIELKAGAPKAALTLARESVELAYRLRDLKEVAASLDVIGAVLVSRGDPERAARLLGAADALRQTTGTPPWITKDEDIYPAVRAHVAAELGGERYEELHSEGLKLDPDAALALAIRAVD